MYNLVTIDACLAVSILKKEEKERPFLEHENRRWQCECRIKQNTLETFFVATERTGHKVLILSVPIVLLPLFWFWNPNNKNNVQTKLENLCNSSANQLSQCQLPLATKRQMSDR